MRCVVFLPFIALLLDRATAFTPSTSSGNEPSNERWSTQQSELGRQSQQGHQDDHRAGHFEFSMLQEKAALNQLMNSESFRASLNSETAPFSPRKDSRGRPHRDDHGIGHFEYSLMRQKVALDRLMQSEGFRAALDTNVAGPEGKGGRGPAERKRGLEGHSRFSFSSGEIAMDEDHGVHHFEFVLLREKAALGEMLTRGAFRSCLDSEESRLSAANMASKNTTSHMWASALKQKAALDKLMRTMKTMYE